MKMYETSFCTHMHQQNGKDALKPQNDCSSAICTKCGYHFLSDEEKKTASPEQLIIDDLQLFKMTYVDDIDTFIDIAKTISFLENMTVLRENWASKFSKKEMSRWSNNTNGYNPFGYHGPCGPEMNMLPELTKLFESQKGLNKESDANVKQM